MKSERRERKRRRKIGEKERGKKRRKIGGRKERKGQKVGEIEIEEDK